MSSGTNTNVNLSGLNSMVALSNNTNVKNVQFPMPFQSVSSLTAPPVSSISIPLRLFPAQVVPILSTTGQTTYMYPDYGTSTQTPGMYGTPTFMFTNGTPIYCHTPSDPVNYGSTPNLIHGLQSPLSSNYEGFPGQLATLPMATPLLSGMPTNGNNYGYPAPMLNRRSDPPTTKMFREQKSGLSKLSPFTTDSLTNSMEHLFLAGNITPAYNETTP